MSQRYDPRTAPAWPVGCALAFLALLLIVNVAGLGGILFATAGLPTWAERGGPILLALTIPALMLFGGLIAHRRNPYAARVLFWGLGLTLAIGAALTLLLNLIDRLSGV